MQYSEESGPGYKLSEKQFMFFLRKKCHEDVESCVCSRHYCRYGRYSDQDSNRLPEHKTDAITVASILLTLMRMFNVNVQI
jgi:hypothetical protein